MRVPNPDAVKVTSALAATRIAIATRLRMRRVDATRWVDTAHLRVCLPGVVPVRWLRNLGTLSSFYTLPIHYAFKL